jgi:iron complex transport system substrate-binding protein
MLNTDRSGAGTRPAGKGRPAWVVRLVAATAIGVLVAAALGACGSGSDDDGADDGASGSGEIRIEHALGTTVLDAPPERVVALGPTDLDAALALGANVVGTASSGVGDGVPPWTDEAGADSLTVLATSGDALDVDPEEVAELQPDLILAATYYSIDDAYDVLSQIAPTTAYQAGPTEDTWHQVTEQVGQALGDQAAATRLVDGVESQLTEAGERGGVDGATFTFGFVTTDGVSTLRDPDDVMMTVPEALGFTLSPPVLDLPEGDSFAVDVSFEQLDVLEADVLALYDGGDAGAAASLDDNPLFAALPVVERGGVVELDGDEFYALRQPTALSIPYLLDGVAPRLLDAATA